MLAPRETAASSASFAGTAVIATSLCLWEGLPFTLIGLPNLIGLYLYALSIFFAFGVFCVNALFRGATIDYWRGISILLFSLCITVSVLQSAVLNQRPLPEWLPASYTITPILSIFLFKMLKCRLYDAIRALYLVGFFGSLLTLINNIGNLGILDFYIRGSGFGTVDRVVFVKLESTFALVIALVGLSNSRKLDSWLLNLIVAGVTGYNVIVLSESRLAIAAFLLSALLVWILLYSPIQKIVIGMLGAFIAIPVVSYVLLTYLGDGSSFSDYSSRDVSISFRMIEINNFEMFFNETGGMGFGFMSGNPEYRNPIAFSANQAGLLYGVGKYPLSLDDIGLYAALYQYGYVGLVLVIIMTASAIWSLLRLGRSNRQYMAAGACGLLMAAFLISPLPMNFFTIFYAAHVGGLLWFMAAEASAIYHRSLSEQHR